MVRRGLRKKPRTTARVAVSIAGPFTGHPAVLTTHFTAPGNRRPAARYAGFDLGVEGYRCGPPCEPVVGPQGGPVRQPCSTAAKCQRDRGSVRGGILPEKKDPSTGRARLSRSGETIQGPAGGETAAAAARAIFAAGSSLFLDSFNQKPSPTRFRELNRGKTDGLKSIREKKTAGSARNDDDAPPTDGARKMPAPA